MRGQPDLFGEIHEDKQDEERDEILKIALEATEKRGYAIYRDFYEYMEQRRVQKKLKVSGGGFYHHTIRECLKGAGWIHDASHRPTQFYPPGTELPQLKLPGLV